MIIKAIKKSNGKWIMQVDNGELPQEGLEHDTRGNVYADCSLMYPYYSVWRGCKVKSGYYINND